MICEPIRRKSRMYELLNGGAFGNTIPTYSSLESWRASSDFSRYPHWGVRVLRTGDPRMRLNVPTEEVAEYVQKKFPDGDGFNISPMIDPWCIFKGEVFEPNYAPHGLVLFGSFGPGSWREQLRDHGRHWHGLAAITVLQFVCNPASYEDIRELLDLYPGHVVEFSACDRPVGKIPTRNAVIWEVREY